MIEQAASQYKSGHISLGELMDVLALHSTDKGVRDTLASVLGHPHGAMFREILGTWFLGQPDRGQPVLTSGEA